MTAQIEPLPGPCDPDPQAIYDRYYSRVHRFALRRFGPRDAEDIAQETLARCFAHAGRIDLGRDLWPWLRTVAHNVGCDVARNRTRHVAVPDETLDALHGPSGHDASYDVLRREEHRLLRQAMRRLSPADRLILQMREVEELGFDAIADFLGMTANNARQRVFRARLRLGKIYAELGGRVRGILVVLVGGRAWLRRRTAATSARTQELSPLFSSPVVYCVTWAATVAVGAGALGATPGGGLPRGDGRHAGALRSGSALLAAGWLDRDPRGPAPDGRPAKVRVRDGHGESSTRISAEAGPASFQSRFRDPNRRSEPGETDSHRFEIDTPIGPVYVAGGNENQSGGPGTICILTGVCMLDG